MSVGLPVLTVLRGAIRLGVFCPVAQRDLDPRNLRGILVLARVVVVSLLLAAAPAHVVDNAFAAPLYHGRFESSTDPNASLLAVEDLDGDGFEDLLFPRALRLNARDGSFEESRPYGVVVYAVAVDVGDLNGDPNPDLALIDYPSAAIKLLLGNGDGTFDSLTTVPVPGYGVAIELADIDEDGLTDLVVLLPAQLQVVFFKNYGSNIFVPMTTLFTGLQPTSMFVMTLDASPHLDIVVTNKGSSSILAYFGNGDGTFSQPQTTPVAGNPDLGYLADLNGDSRLDVLLLSKAVGRVGIQLANGDGTFSAAPDLVLGHAAGGLAAGLVDGDASLDLLVTDNQTSFSVYPGYGDGSFDSPRVVPTENGPTTIAALHLDEGVDRDVVVGTSGDGTWTLHRGNGDFSFGKSTDIPLSGRAYNVALADLDLDSVPDLCVVHGNSISVALGHGDGSFGSITTIPSTPWASFVGIGDLNRDGAPDIVVCGQTNLPTVGLPTFHPGNGDGTFGPSSTMSTPAACSAVALDDFNGDGILDAGFAYGRQPSHVAIFLGQTDGTLLPGTICTCDVPDAGWTGGIASADLNGDDVPDMALAIGGASGGLCLFEGNGDGTFAPAVVYPVPYASTVRIGSVTADGYDDLVCTTSYSALVAILPGRGDGTFGPRTDLPAKGIPRYLDLADLNNDGQLDIVYPDASDVGAVSLFLGSGDGAFEPRLDLGVDRDPVAAAAADLDHDGYLDIVSANDLGRSITILMHRGVLSVDVVEGAGGSIPPAGDLDVVEQASGLVRVRYRLSTASEGVRLSVYDVRGRLVRSLDAGQRNSGQYEIFWNRTSRAGQRVSSGIYFVHLEAGMESATRKVLLIGRR